MVSWLGIEQLRQLRAAKHTQTLPAAVIVHLGDVADVTAVHTAPDCNMLEGVLWLTRVI
jgi:hypothetical protein